MRCRFPHQLSTLGCALTGKSIHLIQTVSNLMDVVCSGHLDMSEYHILLATFAPESSSVLFTEPNL